jgi:hypothetical protein
VSAAEKRDYEEVFIACQVSIACFNTLALLSCRALFRTLSSLAAIETSG